MKYLFLIFGFSLAFGAVKSQCQPGNFFGLQSTYSCPDPTELFGEPFGGFFQGSGINGSMFSPVQAGVGTHIISYSLAPSSPIAGYVATPGLVNAPISASFNSVSLSDDQLSPALPIGFDFNFFGVTYNEFRISSNGYITFDLTTFSNGCCQGQTIPDSWDPNNLIALAWNDLNPSNGGTIGYTTIGTAPNRILVVDFNEVPHFGGGGLNVTVQAHLFEANGNIEIHCTTNVTDGSGHTIGVENASGTCGITAPGMNASFDIEVLNQMIRFSPDAASYYGHQTGLPVAAYTGTFTPIALVNNALSGAIPVGFDFDFYGTNYNELFVSSNGFLTFSNGGDNGCCSGGLLPNSDLPNNLIAFAWNDLNPELGGTIGYTTIGTSPDRIFVLDFSDIQHSGGGSPVSVQVKLFESSNLIEIHSTQNESNGTPMTMGLENGTGTEALSPPNRNANASFSVNNERTVFYPYYTIIQVTEVISIDDVQPPIPFEPFPMTITAQCEVTFIEDQYAFDNCSDFVVGVSDAVFPITETTTITWTFTDAAGNESTTTQEIIIDDTTAPVASGFLITIVAQSWFADEVSWTFTDASNNVVASGGPYFSSNQGEVLEEISVSGTNGPYTFFGSTVGPFADNAFSFTIICQGETVASGNVAAGQTTSVSNIASCNSFAPLNAYCGIFSLDPVFATDNCVGIVEGTNDAVLPITSSTIINWTFDDGNGNITVEQQQVNIVSLNTEILFIGGTLYAVENGAGVGYSWVDCNNNNAPVGSSSVSYTPTVNGSYAVVLTIGDCSEITPCFAVTNVGVQENGLGIFQIYPNPAQNATTVNSTVSGVLDLIDMSGKIVKTSMINSGENNLNLQGLSSGAYTLRVISTDGVYTQRFVINAN
jgi:hypothetical protein